MKKLLALLMVLTLAVSFVACDNTSSNNSETTAGETGNPEDIAVMTYEEYAAAALDSKVKVETYIQAKQGWWEKEGVGGVATFYTQNEDGAIFIYDMPCTQEDYNSKLTVGAKIRVTGTKAAWDGEVEIVDATYEVLEGTWTASALDITDKLADETLINYQNQRVAFKGMTVEAMNEDGAAFLYKWDGSGQEGDDLYFKAKIGETVVTFVIESYLTGSDTDVYKAVKELKVGDVVDMEGFLYWYQGVQPHITSVTVVTPEDTAEDTADAADTAAE